MTPEILNYVRQQTKENMIRQLELARIDVKIGIKPKAQCLNYFTQAVAVLNEDNVLDKLEELNVNLAEIKTLSVITPILTQSPIKVFEHCQYTFTGTTYTIKFAALKAEITEDMVTVEMKKYVSRALTPSKYKDDNYYHTAIQCGIMDMFKAGTITWDECYTAHNTPCT